ncbi:MAG: twin-arginine translocation signal domain-containing protein [Actinomycetota bacterium]
MEQSRRQFLSAAAAVIAAGGVEVTLHPTPPASLSRRNRRG